METMVSQLGRGPVLVSQLGQRPVVLAYMVMPQGLSLAKVNY